MPDTFGSLPHQISILKYTDSVNDLVGFFKMTRLTTKDASILARLAQYDSLPQKQRLDMLKAATRDGQHVGRVLLRLESPESDDVREIAEAIEKWVGANRRRRASATARKRRSSRARYSARSL
jgi:hypothetical protein